MKISYIAIFVLAVSSSFLAVLSQETVEDLAANFDSLCYSQCVRCMGKSTSSNQIVYCKWDDYKTALEDHVCMSGHCHTSGMRRYLLGAARSFSDCKEICKPVIVLDAEHGML